MPDKHLAEMGRLKNYFLRNKKKVLKSLLLSFLFIFLTCATVGLRFFYPYHFFISLIFLALSIRYLIASFLFDRKKVEKSHTVSSLKQFLLRHKVAVVVVILSALLIKVIVTVIPSDKNPFAGLSEGERSKLIETDLEISTVLMDNLELSGNELIESPALLKKSLSVDDVEELHRKWNTFLSVAIETEKVTDTHRYFSRVSIFKTPQDHARSFIIAYSLYIKKFELFDRLIQKIDGNETAIKALNEYSPVFGGKHSYDDVIDRFFSSDSLIRRSLGRVYIVFLDFAGAEDESDAYATLREESEKSHTYLLKNLFNTTVNAAKKERYDLEKNLFSAWFPVQKNVANMMGNVRVSSRHEKLITLSQIADMKKVMVPGDIMLQRRNWYASNMGIPGFWPHAALYIGTLPELEMYFAELFPFEGFANVSELLEARHPKLLEKYDGADENGYPYSVIEGKAPGIILQSLEESAHADYVGVMRARLSKADTFKAVLRAFENFGKPYDYNFDFETRDEIVCSELVYDAYLPSQSKKGLDFELTMTSGRKIVSGNSMVEKYYNERGRADRQLNFVYFLDGNEELGKAFVKNEQAFATSWTRPKYSWFQE